MSKHATKPEVLKFIASLVTEKGWRAMFNTKDLIVLRKGRGKMLLPLAAALCEATGVETSADEWDDEVKRYFLASQLAESRSYSYICNAVTDEFYSAAFPDTTCVATRRALIKALQLE